MVVIALPVFGLRLGSSDASTDPTSSTTHQAYTALATGFGPGFSGPLELVGQVSSPADVTAFDHLLTTAARTPGVASVTTRGHLAQRESASWPPFTRPPARRRNRPSPWSTTSATTSSRQAEAGTTLQVHVGGATATNIDFSHVLSDKLPLFIAVVVILAFILLMAVFRSLLIPWSRRS